MKFYYHQIVLPVPENSLDPASNKDRSVLNKVSEDPIGLFVLPLFLFNNLTERIAQSYNRLLIQLSGSQSAGREFVRTYAALSKTSSSGENGSFLQP